MQHRRHREEATICSWVYIALDFGTRNQSLGAVRLLQCLIKENMILFKYGKC